MSSGRRRVERLVPRAVALRLALTIGAAAALLLVLVLAFTLYRVHRYCLHSAAGTLLAEIREVEELLATSPDPTADLAQIVDAFERSESAARLDFLLLDAAGRTLYESDPALRGVLADVPPRPASETDVEELRHRAVGGRGRDRLLASFEVTAAEGTRYRCLAALDPRFASRAVRNIASTFFWALLAGSALFFLVGAALARRAYAPVRAMIQRAREANPCRLDVRLQGSGAGDELDELATAFNQLFDRLHAAFEREREFSARVAHELRTPLAAIRGSIESVLLSDGLPDPQRESLADAVAATDRMVQLVEHMLFLSRADSGQQPALAAREVPVAELVESACALVLPLEQEREARLRLAVAPDLRLRGNPDLLLRMLVNLLGNAVQHTPPGTPIEVHATPDDGWLRLEVCDRGPGIPPARREQVFQRFYSRSRAGGDAAGGIGLGLSIARTIAALHGGTLTCEEPHGSGACFVCRLPLHRAPRAASGATRGAWTSGTP